MKIITWNCNGAWGKKFHLLEHFEADIYVIQECEDPTQSNSDFPVWMQNFLWEGNNKNKGLGIFSNLGFRLKQLDWDSNGLELFLPCKITETINLIGVWTKKTVSPNMTYAGQIWNYIQRHNNQITNQDTIICGDFNSNKCWNEKYKNCNHSDVVQSMEDLGLVSLYHQTTNLAQGNETKPTLYLYRNLSRPYHIDYAFVPHQLITDNSKLEVGNHGDWLDHSDHMPIIFEI